MINRMISAFLDTTPRQWLIFWAETFRIDYKNPKQQLSQIALSFYGIQGLALIASLILHALLLISSQQSLNSIAEDLNSSSTEVLELQDKKTLAALIAQQEMMSLKGVYYLDGKEIEKVKTIENTALSGLLKKLKSGKNTWSLANNIAIPAAVAKVSTDTNKSSFTWQQVVENRDQKTNSSKTTEDKLAQQIAKYETQFQGCYEKALLRDSSMNGKIEFLMKIGRHNTVSQANISFEGVGLANEKSQLEACLQNIVSKIRITDNEHDLNGKKIKFYAMLKAY